MIIGASIPWPGPGVGCFDPASVLCRLGEAFGDALEIDPKDHFDGHHERVLQVASELGIDPERPAVRSAARKVRELGPRYGFRLRVAPGAFVSGSVDRYSVRVACDGDDAFPEPARGRFVEFLRSLRLGEIRLERIGGQV